MFYVQLLPLVAVSWQCYVFRWLHQRSRNQDPILVLVLSGIAIGSLLWRGHFTVKNFTRSFHPITFDYLLVIRQFHGCWRKRIKSTYPSYFNTRYSAAFLLRWRLNLLALEEDEAKSLGIPIQRTRYILIIFTTLCTASAVSITGIIGWVGLFVPHIARLLVGANFILLLPTSLLLGASFLLHRHTRPHGCKH